MNESITVIIILLVCIGISDGFPAYKLNESIFLTEDIKNYCDMKCGHLPHTLCQTNVPRPCDNFRIYGNVKEDLIQAINGLRDRIAFKMKVSNMIKLRWDNELGNMANAYLRFCKPLVRDPCTDLGQASEEAIAKEPRYYHVSSNSGFRRSKFKPYDLLSSILRDWYYGKNSMDPPEIFETDYGDDYGVLKGHNNFTRLANPQVSRMGCGLARMMDGYGLICYFFPYYQRDVMFYRGSPASNCPNKYPLKGIIFNNLCTAGSAKSRLDNRVFLVCLVTYGYRMFRLRVQGGLIFWQKWNW